MGLFERYASQSKRREALGKWSWIAAFIALTCAVAVLAIVNEEPKFVPVDFCAHAPAPCR